MISAFNFSKTGQALLDIAVKVGSLALVTLFNFVIAGLSNGSIQLPYPAISIPAVSLVVSQLDSLFIAWAQKNNVPVPQV